MLRRQVSLCCMFLQSRQGNIFTSSWDYRQSFSNRHIQNQEVKLDNQLTWEQARPLSEIPSPPRQFLFGHANLLAKNVKRIHKFHGELRKGYGNIVLLSVPGQTIVLIYNPDDSRILLNNDGRTPSIAGFEIFVFYR